MEDKKIIIKKDSHGDTRHAPKDTTFNQFHEANLSHINDVQNVMNYLSNKLKEQGEKHDWSKLEYEVEFFKNFLDTLHHGKDFVSNTWYQKHIDLEKHHPLSKCHDDINLLDVLEMIADCVCAGKARAGEIREMEIDQDILKLAFDNTVKLLDDITETKD